MSQPTGKKAAKKAIHAPRAPDLFTRDEGVSPPAYRLCITSLQTWGDTPDLDPAKVEAVGIADPEKIVGRDDRRDVVEWAAANGLVTNPAFVDLVDGCLSRAPCICCSRARTISDARRAEESIRSLAKYFSRAQYLASNGFYRTVERLLRDVTADELKYIKEYAAGLYDQPGDVRILSARKGLCVMAPPCSPSILWVYSTLEGRRLLRHVARHCRKKGAPAKVYLTTQRPSPVPRLSYRLYAVEVPREKAADLWSTVHSIVTAPASPASPTSPAMEAAAAPPHIPRPRGRKKEAPRREPRAARASAAESTDWRAGPRPGLEPPATKGEADVTERRVREGGHQPIARHEVWALTSARLRRRLWPRAPSISAKGGHEGDPPPTTSGHQ